MHLSQAAINRFNWPATYTDFDGSLNAVICLLSSYYAFNAQYPLGKTGHSKNVFVFLKHTIISERKAAVPVSVNISYP